MPGRVRVRIQLTEDELTLLSDSDALGRTIYLRDRPYTLQALAGKGFKGVVWKVTDDIGRLRALKLTTIADYSDRSFLLEASRAAALEPYPQFARFVDCGIVSVGPADATRSFVAFVEEWVDGTPLNRFLETNEVTTSFFVGYVTAMCEALSALRATGLVHDDLHTGNVMVAQSPSGVLSESL
jgi:serine/threonine protein kinase